MKRAADHLLPDSHEWDPVARRFFYYRNPAVMVTPGFAHITETSGDRRYWDIAMEGFRRQVGQQGATGYLCEEARGSMAEAAPTR
jgi:hypothetical protein